MNSFLASLAVADILMVPLVAPGYALFNCIGNEQPKSCRLFIAMKDFIFMTSCLHMLAILYDRHCAVFKPLRYSVTMTTSTVKRLLIGIWVSPVIVTSVRCVWYANPSYTPSQIRSIDKIYDNVLLAVFVLFPILLMTVVNIGIIGTLSIKTREHDADVKSDRGLGRGRGHVRLRVVLKLAVT